MYLSKNHQLHSKTKAEVYGIKRSVNDITKVLYKIPLGMSNIMTFANKPCQKSFNCQDNVYIIGCIELHNDIAKKHPYNSHYQNLSLDAANVFSTNSPRSDLTDQDLVYFWQIL